MQTYFQITHFLMKENKTMFQMQVFPEDFYEIAKKNENQKKDKK